MISKIFTLSFLLTSFVSAFINPGVGIGLPSGFKIPSIGMQYDYYNFQKDLENTFFLGNGGYVSSVYKVPEEEYVIDEYSTSYEVPQAGYNAPSSSYKAPTSTSYNTPSTNYAAPSTSYQAPESIRYKPPKTSYKRPGLKKHERDTHNSEVPLYYGDTFDQV